MSALINIAGLTPVEDPSYRYKMPKIAGKIEGRGNGIKTLLCNVKDVALSLNREAPEITKFFGTELGAQTTYETETERAIVNGAHSDVLLQSKLSTYIEKFVLCSNCHLPETHYKIKDGIITQKCLACGTKTVCEMTHKLTTFILAQDKKAKADAKKEGKDKDKKDKKDKKEKKEKKEAAAGGGAATADGAEGDGGAKASTSEKKEKKEKKDKSPREGEPGESTEKKKKSKEKKTFFDSEAPEDGDEDVDDAKAAGAFFRPSVLFSCSRTLASLDYDEQPSRTIRASFVPELNPLGSTRLDASNQHTNSMLSESGPAALSPFPPPPPSP